jgi:Transposase
MRKERKHFTPEEKVAILRRHLVDKVPVSELCEELGLRPTMFYRWQKFWEICRWPRKMIPETTKKRPLRRGGSMLLPSSLPNFSTWNGTSLVNTPVGVVTAGR